MIHLLSIGRFACAWATLCFLSAAAQQVLAQAQPVPLGSHTSGVAAARYTPDGQLVITGGFDRTLQIHNAADGKLLRTLTGHTGQVLSLAIAPDGRSVFSGGRDQTLHKWDVYIPRPLAELAGHAAVVRTVAVSKDDAWIATGSADNSLRLFSRADGKLLFELKGHAAALERLAVKLDNTQLASGDAQGVVRLWNPADGSAQGLLGAHAGEIRGLAYHPTASTLWTAGSEGTVKLWALPLPPPKGIAPAAEAITALALSADGSLVIAGDAAAGVRVASGATGEVARTLAGHVGPVSSLALSADAALVASGSTNGEIRLWNVADGAPGGTLLGHAGKVSAISIAAAKDKIASAGEDGTIRLWRLPQAGPALAGHTLPIQAVAVSADGKLIATGAADKAVRLHNPADGALVRALAGYTAALTALSFSTDSTQLATADAQGEVRLWNVADGAPQGTLLAHASAVTAAQFSPDGKQLYTASADGTWKAWQLPVAPPRTLLTAAAAAKKLALSADGKQLVIGTDDGKLSLIDPTAAQPAKELAGQVSAPTTVALAGGLIAAGNNEGEIRLWNAADGASRLTLLGHTGAVRDIAIAPTGNAVASAGADGTVRVWKLPVAAKLLAGAELSVGVVAWSGDRSLVALGGMAGTAPTVVVRNTATGAVVATLTGHTGLITSVAFSSDKSKLISGSADKTARVWNLADPKFTELAKFEHAAAATAVMFSADGAQAFSAAADNSLKQWAVADGAEVRALAGHAQPVTALAVAGQIVYSAGADGNLRGWKVGDGTAAGNFNAGAAVTSLAVSASGAQLAVGLADKTVKVITAADGKPVTTLTGHAAAPTSVAISPDGLRVASVATDGVRIFNAAGVLLERMPLGEAPAKGVAFTADGTAVLAADAKNGLHVLTPSLAQVLAAKGEFTALTMSPDGASVFVGAADGTLGQYSTADLKPLKTFTGGGAAAVTDLDLSPDAKLLVASSADKSVRVWDLAAAGAATTVPATKTLTLVEAASSVRVIAGGTRLVTAGGDLFVRVWDLASGAELQRFAPHAAAVEAMTASADGAVLYSASSDKLVVASATSALRVVVAADPKVGLADASLARDGKWFATAAGGAVKLWDAATGVMAHELATSPQPLASVALRGDGAQLAAGGSDAQLYLWPLTPQGPGAVIKVPVPTAIKRLNYDSAGQRLAVACEDGNLRVYDSANGRLLEVALRTAAAAAKPLVSPAIAFTADGQALVGAAAEKGYVQPLGLLRLIAGHEGAATGVAFSPDGTKLISAGADKTVRLWNATDGAPLGTFAGAAEAVTSLSLSANGTLLAVACGDKNVHAWEVPAAAVAQPIAVKFTLPHAALVHSVSISGDGARLATSDAEGTVRVFDVATSRELERFTGHAGAAHAVALAANGKMLVSGGTDKTVRIQTISAQQVFIADPAKLVDAVWTADGAQVVTAGTSQMTVKIWDATGKEVRACAAASAPLARLAVRNDAQQIAGCDAQGKLLRWNVADGALLGTTDTGGTIQDLAYSDDGQHVVVAGATQLSVYDSAEAGVLLQYPATTPLSAARFVPSGREIVTGSDKLANVWTYASPTSTAMLTGHQGPVYSLATSLDGKLVASAGGDQTIRLWNAATGEVVRQLPGHAGAVYGVHFSDDSTKLVSTGADGTVRLWDVAAGTELKKFALPVAEGERVAAMYAASLSPNGQTVAASGAGALVQVWQVNSGQAAAPLPAQAEAIYRVAYNRAGTRLLTCGHAGNLAVWDAAGGQPLFTTKLPAVAYDASLSPDGARVVAACADGKAYVVELPANAR